MSTNEANAALPTPRKRVVDSLTEEAGIWLFVCKTLLAFYLTGWLAMRLSLPQPSSAMLTTIIVANRQSGMVLAKSFYRCIGTLAGAVAAFFIVGLFPQQRELFLAALSLWVGLCAGGATLYRNFASYAFVLAGYSAAIIAIPVINDPPAVFDSAVARISEVLLGLLVSGVVSDIIFPSRMRDVLRRTAHAQFAHFIGFVQGGTGGNIARDSMEKAHLRFVRDAARTQIALEKRSQQDARKSWEDAIRAYKGGVSGPLTPLISRQQLLLTEQRLAALESQQADASIRLIEALGGGYGAGGGIDSRSTTAPGWVSAAKDNGIH